jgi:hypothetical protein
MIEKKGWSFKETYLIFKFLNFTRDKLNKDEMNYKLFHSLDDFQYFSPNVAKHLLGMLNAKYYYYVN